MIALDRFARTGAATALALALSLSCAGGAFAASEATKHSKSPPVLPPQELRNVDETTGAPVEAKPTSEVENYCLNIADKAQDARYAIQEKQLRELEGEITSRIDELETRRAEYQKWMEERKAFLESASTVVVDIYSKMKSDAAAPQLAKLGNENAAMILVRLKPRQARRSRRKLPSSSSKRPRRIARATKPRATRLRRTSSDASHPSSGRGLRRPCASFGLFDGA